MITYQIRRLVMEGEAGRRYHLYDRTDQLMLVADEGSAWLPANDFPQVRFARPDGERVATMDLPRPTDRRPDKKQNFAIIYEHAVYALITALDLSGGTSALLSPAAAGYSFDRLVIEVEGHRWLGLCRLEDEGPLLRVYDMDASGLVVTVDQESADLPEPIGFLEAGTDEYDFALTMPAGRPGQGPLLGLALVYLADDVA